MTGNMYLGHITAHIHLYLPFMIFCVDFMFLMFVLYVHLSLLLSFYSYWFMALRFLS